MWYDLSFFILTVFVTDRLWRVKHYFDMSVLVEHNKENED